MKQRSLFAIAVVAVLSIAACDDGSDDSNADDGDAGGATPSTTEAAADVVVTTSPPSTAPPAETTPPETAPAETTSSSSSAPPASTESAASAACPSMTHGPYDTFVTVNDFDYAVRVYIPVDYARVPLPTVIDWHGLGSNGEAQASFSGYEALAEEEGFIVVHPTGLPDTPDGPNSWQVALDSSGSGRDDIAFANSLIDRLVDAWCADETRIYSTGMSNGGFFTARLICEMADRIAAAVSVAGTYHPEGCVPSRVVPYQAIHGTEDGIVPYDGSGESVLLTPDAPDAIRVFFEQVMPAEFAEFAADAGCAPTPTDTSVGEDTIRHDYSGCANDTPMSFFEVTGGGHTWPGSPELPPQSSLGYTTDDIDATVDGWAFMSQFTLPG